MVCTEVNPKFRRHQNIKLLYWIDVSGCHVSGVGAAWDKVDFWMSGITFSFQWRLWVVPTTESSRAYDVTGMGAGMHGRKNT
jgi:hypothetical protein